jgi:excisionase family DNA binding protein
MARRIADERQTLTVEEAARVLGIARGSAYEAAKVGHLPTIRIGRRLLVPRAALERLLAGGGAPAAVGPR